MQTELAIRIKYFRRCAGLNQTELSKKIGVSASQVSKYESGAAEPRPRTLKKIADALKIDIRQILGDIY